MRVVAGHHQHAAVLADAAEVVVVQRVAGAVHAPGALPNHGA